MTIVIDASVAVKWVLDEPLSDAAFALRGEDMIAPALWRIEAANALWRRAALGELTLEGAEVRLLQLMNAPVATLWADEDLRQALRLSADLNHPVYDCLYLAMAVREDTYVVTADRRFHAVAAARDRNDLADRVRMLGAH